MVSLMPRYWRNAPASITHSAPARAPATQASTLPARLAGRGHWVAAAAQARPPSTSAPSPPITTRPAWAGSATHSAVSISGAARCRVFCHEKASPKAPLKSSQAMSNGSTPASQTSAPNTSSAAARAPMVRAISRRALRMMEAVWASDRADHAFDEVVHLFELKVGLLEHLAGGQDGVALVVLERALEDVEAAREHLGLDLVGVLLGRLAHAAAIGRHLHVAFLQAAAQEVGVRLAGLGGLDDGLVGGEPVPFGAGQVGGRGQLGLAGVVAADHLAALGGGLDHHLGAVDVHGEHVHALIGQAVGGLGLLDGHGPVAREDHAAGDVRVHRARAQQEGIDVAQHLRNRLGGHEADLAALAHVAGHHAIEVLAFVDVAEEAAHVLGVFAFGPQAATVREAHI